jgi:pSer/pThr/pTyr-binding forkhead associated (FHA) protein
MSGAYGKLILTLPGGQQQEFALSKPSVTLGRAMTNDIVLPDTRVSRNHARVDCGPDGCTIVDLNSANGVRFNGTRVTTAPLAPGDTLSLGESQLRYESAGANFEPELTVINSPSELEATLAQMTLSVALNDTTQPRLVVKTPDKTWEVSLEGKDALTIGRHTSNDLVLDVERVSRRHARLERRGPRWVLTDLGSTNGVWLGSQRIDSHTLADGDGFQIGRVQFLFKAGFMPEELTMVDQPLPNLAAPRRPVVFVPGLMGSELWSGRERIWPNVKVLFSNPEILRLDSRVPLEPRGIVGEVVIVPNLVKLEQYSRLGDYLVEDLGYRRGVDLLEFAYDWRQDVRLSAQQLAETIEAWNPKAPVTLMGHSLGTLVSRYYVEKLGGKRRVERLILMGGPHRGVPKAAAGLVLGPNILPFGLLGDRLREVMANFPTSYQILPTYPCALDQDGKPVDLLQEEGWLAPHQVPLLQEARAFRAELGMHTSVSTLCIFGYGLKTIMRLSLQRTGTGWGNWAYAVEPGGDSSVPESSAILDNVEIHPVQQYHGSLFVDNDVKMRLKLELTRRAPVT